MKKMRLCSILLCCALVIGLFTLAAHADFGSYGGDSDYGGSSGSGGSGLLDIFFELIIGSILDSIGPAGYLILLLLVLTIWLINRPYGLKLNLPNREETSAAGRLRPLAEYSEVDFSFREDVLIRELRAYCVRRNSQSKPGKTHQQTKTATVLLIKPIGWERDKKQDQLTVHLCICIEETLTSIATGHVFADAPEYRQEAWTLCRPHIPTDKSRRKRSDSVCGWTVEDIRKLAVCKGEEPNAGTGAAQSGKQADDPRRDDIYRVAVRLSRSESDQDVAFAADLFASLRDYRDSEAMQKTCRDTMETNRILKNQRDFITFGRLSPIERRKHRHIRIILVIVLAALIGVLIATAPARKHNAVSREAQTYANDHDYDAALRVLWRDGAGYHEEELNALHYAYGDELMRLEDYDHAISEYNEAHGYKDAEEKLVAARYAYAVELEKTEAYWLAIDEYERIGDYKDAKERLAGAHYALAVFLENNGNTPTAIEQYEAAGDYKDAKERLDALRAQP